MSGLRLGAKNSLSTSIEARISVSAVPQTIGLILVLLSVLAGLKCSVSDSILVSRISYLSSRSPGFGVI